MPAPPTIVLVHGAWADNSGCDASIRTVRAQGYAAIGAANLLRELRADAAYVAGLLATINGSLVLVGHSYGGAVIQRRRRQRPGQGARVHQRVGRVVESARDAGAGPVGVPGPADAGISVR